jgi:ABC-type transport system substrate-binding protein
VSGIIRRAGSRRSALLLVVALFACACGTEGGRRDPERPTPAPTASEEVLRFGYPAEPATLDPVATGGGSSATRDILRPVLPALFRLDENLKPQPELAASWPSASDISLDPFTVTVELRAAKWSDGKPITSTDVRFTFSKLRTGPTRHHYRYLRDVAAPSADVVRLMFDRPVRRWWSVFSIDDMVLPAHAYSEEKWKDGPTVSGGPFAFDSWTKGLRIRLVRNDAYGATVPLAGIDVLFVPDDETRLQLLDRDELDAFFSEGESNIGRRSEAYGFEAIGAWGPTWWELDLDPARVRLPVARAVVELASPELVAEILEDSARPMNGIPPDRVTRATAEPWRGRGSLDVAKKVLDEGGVASGSTRAQFQVGYAKVGAAAGLGAFLHHRLRDIGITAELVGVESDTFDRDLLPQGRTPVILRLRRGADAPDASSYSPQFGRPGSGPVDDAIVGAETNVVEERLRTARITGLDPAAWAEAQRGLVAASTMAPLAQVRTWIVPGEGVAGLLPTGASHGPLWNAADWRLL